MRVLITGAGGQIGRALLCSAPPAVQPLAVSHGDLDLTNEPAVLTCVRKHAPDVIVNAAAYTAVDRAESEPERAAAVNARGPRWLAAAAGEVGARLIHLSTDFVFDGRATTPYRPDSPTGPLSAYGRTKLEGEQAVRALLPDRSLILRTAWVYAAEGRNFVRTMLRLMQAHGAVRVVSDQVGTPTAARSVANAIWSIIAREDLTGVHHWTDAGVASWFDFAVAIGELALTLGLLTTEPSVMPIRSEDYPTSARRPAYSVLDTSSLGVLEIVAVPWRQALRGVLEEIANA